MYHQATASVTTSGTRTTVCKPLDWSDSSFRMNYDPSKRPCPAHALRSYEGEGVHVGWGGTVCFWVKKLYWLCADSNPKSSSPYPGRYSAFTQLTVDSNAMKISAQHGTVSSVRHVTLPARSSSERRNFDIL